jgi:transposase
MNVIIGIDPHKASHTAVAIGRDEDQISTVKVRATVRQVDQLLSWAEPFEKRTWAIESVGGLGYLLAQQLVARGEDVLDVPATLASRIRVLATKRSNKNDPNDAHSIAIAALRAPTLRLVDPADHGEVLRLLSKRNDDLGRQRARVICRLHSLFAEVAPGGIAKEMYVSDAETFLAKLSPESPAQQMRLTSSSTSSTTCAALMPRSRSLTAASRQRFGPREPRSPSSMGSARSMLRR